MVSPIITNILDGFKEIGGSFLKDGSLWWFLAPIFLLWILLEIYFGKYKKEKLGWNTALGNGITLLWINIESMRYIFSTRPDNFWIMFSVISLIFAYSLMVIFFAFSHKITDKLEFLLGAVSPIYFLATISILWSHEALAITWWVLLDLVIIYLIIISIFAIIRKVLPEAEQSSEETPSSDFGSTDDIPTKDFSSKPSSGFPDTGIKDLNTKLPDDKLEKF